METKNIIIYSIFSGTVYEVPEKDFKILDVGQVPLLKYPPNKCKKCYGRGYNGRDIQTFAYTPCSCVLKVIDFSKNQVDVSKNI
jgi:hypothetical protein